MAKESAFQARLVKEIKELLPGAVVLKNDSGYLQGFPDLTILYGNRWAALETKRGKSASHRPNQDYYIKTLGEMSFASFIFPENKEEVLYELQKALRPEGTSRFPKRK